MGELGKIVEVADELAEPVTIGADAYISAEFAKAERDKLWRTQWLQAGRTEDIPNVGDYITYDIADDSVIITRSDPGTIRAFHNVCPHRGRKLIDTPRGKRNARGNKTNIICGFHAWTFNLEGKCTFIEHQEDWQGVLTEQRTSLGKVAVGEWGGFVWVNIDSNAGALREYLEPAASMLDPFKLENMRCRWRKWVVFECNWKVAMEAFCETYHVAGTHPEFMEFGQFRGWGRNQGRHSNIGYEAPKGQEEDAAKLRLGTGEDPRQSTWEMQDFTWKHANTNTTTNCLQEHPRLKSLDTGSPRRV
jgi:phenylpropionate dioxygenase-like ring-hydroxylating dioxygenase large terminal subunit